MSNGYNGWTNWETWLTNVHVLDGMVASDINGDISITADEVRDYVEEIIEIGESQRVGIVADIIGGFMQEVNWQELAIHLNADEDGDDDEA